MPGGGSPTLNETHYQFQDDGADANTSTLLGSEDTRNDALSLDTTYFVRGKISNTGTKDATNANIRLEYDLDGAGFNQVSLTSNVIRLVDGGDTDGDSMTAERLTNDGGTPVAGLYEESGDTPNFTIAQATESEFVFAFQIRSADLSPGTRDIELRLTNAGTPLDNYNTPAGAWIRVVIAAPPPFLPYHAQHARRVLRLL